MSLVTRNFTIGSRKGVIADGLLPPAKLQLFLSAASKALSEAQPGNDAYRFVESEAVFATPEGRSLLRETKALAAKHLKLRSTHRHVEAALIVTLTGDATPIHSDEGSCPDCITAIFFCNSRWKPEWGGESFFYETRKEALECVSPKPGRLIAFHSSLLRRVGAPTSATNRPRMAFAIWFRCRATKHTN